MSTPDPRIEVVDTGPYGQISLIACTKCGVLLWSADKHYADAHPDYVPPVVPA